MKKLLFATSILILASCNMESPEALNKQIIANKNKVDKLNDKIAELQLKLDSVSGPEEAVIGTAVYVKEMAPEPFQHFIFSSGKVEAVNEAWVSPEINGQIKQILVSEGDRVVKGQLLVKLNTDITEKSITEVKTGLELAKKLYEKQSDLWEQNIGSEVQYLQAKNTYESAEARLATLEEQLEMAKIRAQFPGIIENISVKEGELAMPGARLLHIVNLKKLKVVAQLSENYLNSIHLGDKVDVEFPATPGKKAALKISRIGSVIENMSRTFEVEMEMSNNDESIKPNQLATMQLTDFSTDETFVVPSIILKQDITGYYLYQVKEDGGKSIASKLYVSPGRSAREFTMIESGIKPGMKIIIGGYNLVKDRTPVKILSE